MLYATIVVDFLCCVIQCFSSGAELGSHKKHHAFTVLVRSHHDCIFSGFTFCSGVWKGVSQSPGGYLRLFLLISGESCPVICVSVR